jgi:Tol biopolymer transport system component
MNYSTKLKTIIACMVLLILAGALSACGRAGDFLSGTGGLGDEVTPTAEGEVIVPEEPIEPPPATPIPAPYGSIIFVSNRDGEMSLYKTTPDGIQQARLTTPASKDNSPVLSPDRTRVAFVATVNENMDIYILDLNTLVVTRVTDAPERDASPSWSPNGQQLVFESFRDGNLEIYITNVDGSNQIRLTNDAAGDSNPVWSPVNNEIAFVSNRFGNSDILLISPNGSVSTLTTSSAPDSAPAWSPDGSIIAFKISVGDLYNLCMISRDGLNQRCLTSIPADYGSPVWSPDGRWIAVNTNERGGYGINVFNIVDGNILQLSAGGIEVRGTPAWSPDGVRLVFQAQIEGDMELFMVTVATNEFTRITSAVAYDGEPIWSDQ